MSEDINPELLRRMMMGDFSASHNKNDGTAQKKSSKRKSLIDLHIEKLPPAYHVKPLEHQLHCLEEEMKDCISKGVQELIVIHGRGEGKLKNAIENKLSSHSKVKKFINLNDVKYKGNALKIIF